MMRALLVPALSAPFCPDLGNRGSPGPPGPPESRQSPPESGQFLGRVYR